MKKDLSEHRNRFSRRLDSALSDIGIPANERIAWLADVGDVSYGAARGWYRSVSLPDANRLELIAEKLGVSLSWLITGKEHAGGDKTLADEDPRIKPSDMLQLISFFSALNSAEREFFLRLANDPA